MVRVLILRKILEKSICLDFSGLWVAFHPFGYGQGVLKCMLQGQGESYDVPSERVENSFMSVSTE